MVKPFSLIAIVAFATTLTSCFKDEAPNNECDIVEARIQVENPDEVFFQQSNAELLGIESTKTDLIFPDLRPNSDVTALPVYFKTTPGATVSPESGSAQNFANGPVTYVITSEDGQYSRTYRVFIKAEEATQNPDQPEDKLAYIHYNFENYSLDPATSKFYMWSDYENGYNWATGNPGFSIARGSAKPDQYPTTPLAEGYDGAAVKLETCDTGPFGVIVNMRIAAGNLFTGVFDSKSATKEPLMATHFGDGSYNQLPPHYSLRLLPVHTGCNVQGQERQGGRRTHRPRRHLRRSVPQRRQRRQSVLSHGRQRAHLAADSSIGTSAQRGEDRGRMEKVRSRLQLYSRTRRCHPCQQGL